MNRSAFLTSAAAAGAALAIPGATALAVVIPRDHFVMERDWRSVCWRFAGGIVDGMHDDPKYTFPGLDNAIRLHAEMGGYARRIEIVNEEGLTFWVRQPIDRWGDSFQMSWHKVKQNPFTEYTSGLYLDLSKCNFDRELILALAYQNGRELYANYRFTMETLKNRAFIAQPAAPVTPA